MAILFSIMSLMLISWWLIKTELPSVFAPALSISLLRRGVLIYGGFSLFLLTLLLDATNRFSDSIGLVTGNITLVALLIISVAAFAATYITMYITKFSSICYALLGAFAGLKIYMEPDIEWTYYLQFVLSWLTAALLSMTISALLYKLILTIISKSSSHIVKLTYNMRLILIIGMAGLIVALGINNGALLVTVNRIALADAVDMWQIILPVASISLLFIIASRVVNININRLADREFDLNIQSASAIVLSAAIVLMLFSIKSIPESIGLRASPLSVSSLLIAGLGGIGIISRKEFIEKERVVKSMGAIIFTPLTALILSYLLFVLLNVDVRTNGTTSYLPHAPNTGNLLSILLLVAILTVITLMIINQQKNRVRSERIAASRQQQLYENQKSLNEMEVKSVLAENRSLYNKLELKRKEMINVALNISEQKEFMSSIQGKLREVRSIEETVEKDRAIIQIEQQLSNKMSFSNEIDTFYSQVELLHRDFGIRLTEKFPKLTEQERRLTTLLRLGFSSKHIATLMNIAPKSVEISRYRLRAKFGLDRGDNLIQFIKSI